MDDLRLYDKVLSSSEVAALFGSGQGDFIRSKTGNLGTIHKAGTVTLSVHAGPVDSMYGAIPTDLNVTISKAPLTITAHDKLRLTNLANPAFTHLTVGFVNDDNESTALLTPPVGSTSAIQSSPEGSYPITLSGATSDKYFITYVPAP